MALLAKLWFLARRLTETHPYVWAICWWVVHRLSFLLPHDRSYLGLAHFADGATGLILDVGANDGISALSLRKIDAVSRILSFEPNPIHGAALGRLRERLELFDYRMIGIGETASEITLHSPVWRGIALHTVAASRVEQVTKALGLAFGARVAREARIDTFAAKIASLDELDLSPSVIKIDTEGHEHEVLKGARATLARCRPVVLFEAWHIDVDAVWSIFDELSYVTASYDETADAFRRVALIQLPQDAASRNLYAIPSERFATLPSVT